MLWKGSAVVLFLFRCISHPQENSNISRGEKNPTLTEKGKQDLCILGAQWISDDSKEHTLVLLRKHYTVRMEHLENRTKVPWCLFLFSSSFWDGAGLTWKDGDVTFPPHDLVWGVGGWVEYGAKGGQEKYF